MRKILIASLGAGNKERKYNKTNYVIEGKIYKNEMYVSSALEQHFNIDKIFYIGTLGSMWENIYEYYCKKYKKEINNKYEEELFYKMAEFLDSSVEEKKRFSLDFINFEEFLSTFEKKVIPVITYYGLDDKEIFENFNRILNVVNELEDGDELYLDITHSFRSNAFWIFLVMNYINDVTNKNITIKYISYGMFEAKEKDKYGIDLTPVINLKVFFDLTKWIKGAYTFKNYGNSDLICELIGEKDIKNKLNNLSNALSINYISSLKESVKSLEENYKIIEKVDGPAKLIIPQAVTEFLNHFKNVEEDYEMFLKLAEWHYKEKRYALVYTNIQEAFISYAKTNGLFNELGVKKDIEELSKQLFKLEIIKSGGKEKRKLIWKSKYENFFDSKAKGKLKDFFESYEYCRQVRNNIAHSDNKRNNPDADIKSLEKILKFLKEIFKEKHFLKDCKEKISWL